MLALGHRPRPRQLLRLRHLEYPRKDSLSRSHHIFRIQYHIIRHGIHEHFIIWILFFLATPVQTSRKKSRISIHSLYERSSDVHSFFLHRAHARSAILSLPSFVRSCVYAASSCNSSTLKYIPQYFPSQWQIKIPGTGSFYIFERLKDGYWHIDQVLFEGVQEYFYNWGPEG